MGESRPKGRPPNERRAPGRVNPWRENETASFYVCGGKHGSLDVDEFLPRSLEDVGSVGVPAVPCSHRLVQICHAGNGAATDRQRWFDRVGLAAGLVPAPFRTTDFYSSPLFSRLFLTARKRNSKETAIALEKLLPKRCQVLGLVTPGIVGRRKTCDFVSLEASCLSHIYSSSRLSQFHMFFQSVVLQTDGRVLTAITMCCSHLVRR